MCHKIPDTEADMPITPSRQKLSLVPFCFSPKRVWQCPGAQGLLPSDKKGAQCHLPMPEGVQVSLAPEWLTELIPHGSLSDMPPGLQVLRVDLQGLPGTNVIPGTKHGENVIEG